MLLFDNYIKINSIIKINEKYPFRIANQEKYTSSEKLVCFQLAGFIAGSVLNKLILTLQMLNNLLILNYYNISL